jgi:DNA invertase Pin-like site-specific DNA recombinase
LNVTFYEIASGLVSHKPGKKESRTAGRLLLRHVEKIKELFRTGSSKRAIATELGISRASVRRLLAT